MNLNIAIVFFLTMAALWTVMTRSLIRSAIGLALTSAILTIIMFRLHSPLAAVFELSVCSGLISVIFVSTISLTEPLTMKQVIEHMRERLTRFWYLPFIVLAVGTTLSLVNMKIDLKLPAPQIEADVRNYLWNFRQVDILGQVIMLLAGAFGVVILFREARKK